MARNPRKAAFCRIVGATLTAEGFQEGTGGRAWWLRSEIGDYVTVDVQSSTNSANLILVNIAVVPGPHFDWIKWLHPDHDHGEAPGPELGIGYYQERVRPAEAPTDWDLTLHTVERAQQLGAFVARDLADPIVPRYRRYLDRDVLLSMLDARSVGVASKLRAMFLAETGDAQGADRAYGPADEDNVHQARQRQWLREYAIAHQRSGSVE